MRRINLFVEDFGHEQVISALLDRFAIEYKVELSTKPSSVRGGHGRAIFELKEYIRDLSGAHEVWPDLLVVAIDGNCKGYGERQSEIKSAIQGMSVLTILAIPDPHIERWLLLDSHAFRTVLGKGCRAPDQKCERDRYKKLLLQAVREAGSTPLIGGMENARDLVEAMDLKRLEPADDSLGRFLRELRSVFKQWARK